MDLKDNVLSFCNNCRICLTIHQQMIAIPTLRQSNELNLLLEYFNIEVMTDVRYPNQICNVCLDQLNNIVLFKQKCGSTFNFLKGVLKELHVKNEMNEIEILPGEFLNELETVETDNEKDEKAIIINSNIKLEKSDVKFENKEREIKINSTIKNNYKCQYCDKIFHIKYQHLRHERTHLKKQFKCDQCPRTFKNNDLLFRHVRIHLGQKPFACTECSQAFLTAQGLKLHKRNNHSNKPRPAIICKECGLTVNNMSAHKKYKHSVYEFPCKYCEKKFPFKSAVKRHINRSHDNRDESFKILCPLCGKVFRTGADLNRHNRSHHSDERNYACKYCGKRFKTGSICGKHMKTHSNIRPFKCTYCDREFIQKWILKNHIRKHTGERPYKCTICSKDFAQSGTLGTHVKLVHGRKLN